MASLESRTLVIRQFDEQRTTRDLLIELFTQAGPVKNVVMRPDHAFIEFSHSESVGYALALLRDVQLFGRLLQMEPKLRADSSHYRFVSSLDAFETQMARNPDFFRQLTQQTERQSIRHAPNTDRHAHYPQRHNRYQRY